VFNRLGGLRHLLANANLSANLGTKPPANLCAGVRRPNSASSIAGTRSDVQPPGCGVRRNQEWQADARRRRIRELRNHAIHPRPIKRDDRDFS
jgi:hypothetical protein